LEKQMPYGFYISAEGANAQSSRIEVIANNLANVDTVGFKRELAIVQARNAEAIDKGLVIPHAGHLEDVGGGTMLRQTMTDFSTGAMKHTGLPTDLALTGEGFFQVKKGNETFLTRAGNFTVTSRGELVTQQGYSVLDENGSSIVINPEMKNWQISDSGTLIQGDTAKNLAIVKPASEQELVKHGENLFSTKAQTPAVAPADRRVASGYLEQSGVQPTIEMTSMIEASRIFEMNLNMMKTQDQMLGNLISRELKV
jgi:flagellar basal-body rod protein FlgF